MGDCDGATWRAGTQNKEKTMVINIQIKNRVATYVPGDALPVCGNAGDTVKFSFDGEWAAHTTKTVRFIWGGNKFHEETFTGDTCPVPTFLNTDRVLIGVIADGGALCSTKAAVPYQTSIRCGGARPGVMSAEAYTHEAKEAAELAAQSAVASEGYANNAATQAAIARTGAELARDYSERSEAAFYELERRNIGGQLTDHKWRLMLLESHLGLDSSVQTVSGNVATIDIPANARQYAKIEHLLCGTMINYWCDTWYYQGVKTIRVLNEAGNLVRKYDIPVASLPDYGWGKSIDLVEVTDYYPFDHYNKIVFKNGRAYYHHLVYKVERDPDSEYYDKRHEGDTTVDSCSCQVLIKLEEPEVIDATEAFDFDGYLDLTDGAQIVFDLLEPEDGEANMKGYLQNWSPAFVSVMFELE